MPVEERGAGPDVEEELTYKDSNYGVDVDVDVLERIAAEMLYRSNWSTGMDLMKAIQFSKRIRNAIHRP